jgi:cysteinyl-tRNA synthetase
MKKWKESDTLRDQLAEQGWFIKDGKDGYELESNV